MATLPRDPLDELIADLERVLPPVTYSVEDELGPLEGLQLAVSAVLYGTAEQRAQVERDLRVQAYWAACRRFTDRQAREKAMKAAASSTATE